MSNYTAVYEERFHQNLRRYTSLRQRIKRCIERVLSKSLAFFYMTIS